MLLYFITKSLMKTSRMFSHFNSHSVRAAFVSIKYRIQTRYDQVSRALRLTSLS